ncbi:MAG TPA: hypothetical protein EYM95_16045, partial [Candidatus Obscuribacterales bacterium]|nr:hypothetical protein [Candidatus Obscuribacterales bacterium]
MGNLFTPDMVKGALQQQQQSAPQIPAQEELGIGGSNDSQLPFFANPDAAPQPQRIQPGQPLKAGATVNVNPAELALRSSILGFLETPEMLANAAGSVAQQGVPVEQRTTAADWLHSLGIPQSPGEILQSPEYRAQVQSAGLPGQVA